MQRRELFQYVASGAALATTSLAIGSACQREAPARTSPMQPLRDFAMHDATAPALTFAPLRQPKR